MTGLTLYALAENYQKLQGLLESGELDEATFTDTMKSLEGDIATKVDNCMAVARTLELEADAFRQEEVRLAERRKSIEANRERIRRYVTFELDNIGLHQVRGSRFFVTVQDSTPKVVIDDEAAIPPNYWREKRELDKAALSTDLKAEKPIPGAHLEQGRSLRVK